MNLSDVPDGLHPMQYAAKLAEDLGLPAKSNVPMIGDSIEAVSKSQMFRGRPDAVRLAYFWMHRRVMEARTQGQRINALWFSGGEYWNVERPQPEQKQRKTCGQCDEGWVKVTEGKTDGGKPIDTKYGAVKRCQCWRANV